MEYILLAFIFYAIILNCGAITLCRTLKRSKQADTGQKATHCRACNVLLIEHNRNCKFEGECDYDCINCTMRDGCYIWERDKVKIVDKAETQINIKEVSMLKEYVTTDTSTLSEIEAKLLLDYFRYKEVVNELKTNYPELAKQYIVDDVKPKRTRKVKTEPVQETIEDWLQIDFAWLKTGRNKLGGGNCRISTSKLTQKSLDRMWGDYTQAYGTQEREQLVSKCPKCNGHFRTTFERGDELVQDEEDRDRMVRLQFTRFTCDDCGHTLIGNCGQYLCEADYDMVTNSIPSKPIYDSENGFNNDSVHDMSEEQIDEIANEPIDELCYCDKCEQNFEEAEMDHGNCPFCGNQILESSYVN